MCVVVVIVEVVVSLAFRRGRSCVREHGNWIFQSLLDRVRHFSKR